MSPMMMLNNAHEHARIPIYRYGGRIDVEHQLPHSIRYPYQYTHHGAHLQSQEGFTAPGNPIYNPNHANHGVQLQSHEGYPAPGNRIPNGIIVRDTSQDSLRDRDADRSIDHPYDPGIASKVETQDGIYLQQSRYPIVSLAIPEQSRRDPGLDRSTSHPFNPGIAVKVDEPCSVSPSAIRRITRPNRFFVR